jgi:hypothetical protein
MGPVVASGLAVLKSSTSVVWILAVVGVAYTRAAAIIMIRSFEWSIAYVGSVL